MAMGVTIDPSFAFPLPIFGINYLNFAFGGRRTRSSRCCSPACWRRSTSSGRSSAARRSTRSVDFFVIAVPSSDRVYDAAGEHRTSG